MAKVTTIFARFPADILGTLSMLFGAAGETGKPQSRVLQDSPQNKYECVPAVGIPGSFRIRQQHHVEKIGPDAYGIFKSRSTSYVLLGVAWSSSTSDKDTVFNGKKRTFTRAEAETYLNSQNAGRTPIPA